MRSSVLHALYPNLFALFAKEKGWRCGSSFISWRSKCYVNPNTGKKQFREVFNPRTRRTRKEPIGLTYQEYRKARSQAIKKQGRGQALTLEEKQHIEDAQRLALKTRKGVQRRADAKLRSVATKQEDFSQKVPDIKGTHSTTTSPQTAFVKADRWGSPLSDEQKKKDYVEADVSLGGKGTLTVNFYGDKMSDPEKGMGSFLVEFSPIGFHEAFQDFVFEKPSKQEIERQREYGTRFGKTKVFNEESPYNTLRGGHYFNSYIPKKKLEEWKKQYSLQTMNSWGNYEIIPAKEPRPEPTIETYNKYKGLLFSTSLPILTRANFARPLKRRHQRLKRRRRCCEVC